MKNVSKFTIAGILFALTPQAFSAQTISFPTAEQISSVSVVLVPAGLYTRAPLDEAGVLNTGCTFSSDDRQQVSELLEIVKSSTEQVAAVALPIGYRRIIYLYLKHEGIVKLLTGPGHLAHASAGFLHSNDHQMIFPVAVRAGTRQELKKWAASGGTDIKYKQQISLCNQVLNEPLDED